MFNDILQTETNDEKIILNISRELIDELYAMHGLVALKELGDMAGQLVQKAAMAQVKSKDDAYFDNLQKKIFKELTCKKEKKNV